MGEEVKDQAKEQLSTGKRKTKTERVRRSNGSVFGKTACASFIIVLLTIVSTWFILIFKPDCIKMAIEILKNIA